MDRFISGIDSTWKKTVRLAGAVAFAAGSMIGVAHAQYVPKAAISLPGGASVTSFDIGWVDLNLGMYYLAERDIAGVVAVNTSTNQIAWTNTSMCGLSGCATSGPNGVYTVNHNQVWAGDGDGTVKVLNAYNGANITTIHPAVTPTGRADEGCWDPSHNVAVFEWSDPGDLFIEFIGSGAGAGNEYQVLKTISFASGTTFPDGSSSYASNGIEQCQWDARTNRIYMNIPEINGPGDDSVSGAVVILDGGTQSIVGHWTIPIADCNGNQGMYIGPRREIGINCSHYGSTGNGSLSISDQASESSTTPIITALWPTIWGGDEMYYDAGSAHYVFSNSNHKPSAQLPFVATSTDTVDQIYPASASEHSVAADARHRQIYFPVVSKAASLKECSSVGGNDSLGCILVLKR